MVLRLMIVIVLSPVIRAAKLVSSAAQDQTSLRLMPCFSTGFPCAVEIREFSVEFFLMKESLARQETVRMDYASLLEPAGPMPRRPGLGNTLLSWQPLE